MMEPQTTVVEYPPDGRFALSFGVADSLKPHVALGEFIDNSLDANADHITIDYSKDDAVNIVDNGDGCPDVGAMVTLGKHSAHATTSSGRWGTGGTRVLIQLGSRFTIRSVHGEVMRQISGDWDRICQTGKWQFDLTHPVPYPGKRGTAIAIRGLRRRRPVMPALIDNLEWTYGPAIKAGKRITIVSPDDGKKKAKHADLVARPGPELSHAVSHQFAFPDGREAVVRMGLLAKPSDKDRHSGACLILDGYRVVASKQHLGIGETWISGLHVHVTMVNGSLWKLNQNKTGWLETMDGDAQEKELDTAICSHPEFAALIAQAKQKTEAVALTGLSRIINLAKEMLFDRSGTRKAKRNPTDHPETGTVEPTGNGKRHSRAAKTQPGKGFPGEGEERKKKAELQLLDVVRDSLGVDADLSSVIEGSGKVTVQINTDHPHYINDRLDTREAQFNSLVISSYAAYLANTEPQQRELWPDDSKRPDDPITRFTSIQSRLFRHYQDAKSLVEAQEAQAIA